MNPIHLNYINNARTSLFLFPRSDSIVRTIPISGISQSNLDDVYEIRACLSGGSKPVVCHRPKTPQVVGVQPIINWVVAEVMRDDRSVFPDLKTAKDEIGEQLSAQRITNFSASLRSVARLFLTALIDQESQTHAFDDTQVAAAAKSALLSDGDLENVITELEFRNVVNRGSNGYITVNPAMVGSYTTEIA